MKLLLIIALIRKYFSKFYILGIAKENCRLWFWKP